ncbi:T9SS type A sorting domain-containing protein [Ferruginibacter sp. SUN106]|uniref:T9SS type A sorting domain-containing protein n=1 Tax=Ferruginibacter sp. SUN106 TaxID=2978348 RepID=UPI003D3629E8
MKEIVILLVTFLGICKGFAQSPDGSIVPDSLKIAAKKSVIDSLPIIEKASVKLFPNPAKNKAELEVHGFEAGIIKLQIVDVNGKLVRDDQRLLVNGNENMVIMFALQPGIYFIVVKQKDRLVKKKMIVQ